jgi:predicted ArsR family transcriptional regulator
VPDTGDLEVHKALADDTRFRLYRYLRLSGRAVSVREIATRLELHPNTLRPHLRRLEEAGLVATDTRKSSGVGRPQTLYSVLEREADEGRDYRLLAEILTGLVSGKRARERAEQLAGDWGSYLVAQGSPKPGAKQPAGPNLALLQDAMARAGFDPRFRRREAGTVDISLRDCPFRELVEERRELVEALHRGLLSGMLGALKPPLRMGEFEPFAERSICRLTAQAPRR